MKKMIDRRSFLAGSVAAAAAVTMNESPAVAEDKGAAQEYYELRAYRIKNAEKQKIVRDYLAKALVPSLNRLGIDRVGVFDVMKKREKDDEDLTLWTLIPYKTLDAMTQLNGKLAADKAYQEAATAFLAGPVKDPPYIRIESWLMKAFSCIPVLELPAETKAGKDRIFEIRIYESHNEDAARRKVHMFNNGETQTMRDTKLAPVFFGETLIGDNVPNLTYMLSAPDMASHKAHWKAFGVHPVWKKMRVMKLYRGTVSKIYNYFLKPLKCSQI